MTYPASPLNRIDNLNYDDELYNYQSQQNIYITGLRKWSSGNLS
jgi:hypothetical protein